MFRPTLTITGNLTRDPEPFTTSEGMIGANLTIAHTPRTLDKRTGTWGDGAPVFMRAVVWKDQARNVVASAHKGDRVIAVGTLEDNTYTTAEGERRQGVKLTIDEIGGSWRHAQTARTDRPGQAPETMTQTHESQVQESDATSSPWPPVAAPGAPGLTGQF